jgi:hypothetical protein
MCHHTDSTSNTNVKRGVNKLITNSRFQFVENMVIRGERDIGTGETDIGTGKTDIGTGERDIGTGERGVGTGERIIGTGGRYRNR